MNMQQQLNGKLRKLFQDSIVVNIPMHLTVDLAVAIRHTREKRIRGLYQEFPSLKKEDKKKEEGDDEQNSDGEDNNNNKDQTKSSTKNKKKAPSHVPQRNQYGSVLDYLEAKYVRGVMIQDEDDNYVGGGINDAAVEEEERGSVYDSDGSFLDDSLLKRDVAEQVLSAATHTKLELVEDDDFFVNVGVLEVEDHDLMDYDPAEDENNKEKPKKSKQSQQQQSNQQPKKPAVKRKRSTSPGGGSEPKKAAKKAAVDKEKKETTPKKASKKTQQLELSDEVKKQIQISKQRADDLRAKRDKLYKETREAIMRMTPKELPRKKKNEKVSIVVPDGKGPGDDVTFNNPHVPGQKLKVKIPKSATAGGKFVVSVPVPSKLNPDNDNNKFGREMQEQLDSFSHAYDDWCNAEAAWRDMDPSQDKFQLHHERMNKFDKLLNEFPKGLVTPIDAAYLRKIVRRARQNKHKRDKTIQRLGELAAATDGKTPGEEKTTTPTTTTTINVELPGKGVMFPTVEIDI